MSETRNRLIGLALAAGLIGLFALNAGRDHQPAPPPPPAHVKDVHGDCLLTGLNNQAMTFAGLVKAQLRNPDSFEHVRTVPGPVADGRFPVTMTYRATNGFGAVDTAIALGEVRVDDCAARVLTPE